MQRDWDLIRAILTQAAEKRPGEMLDGGEIRGWDPLVVNGHIAMLSDAGFLHAAMARGHAMVVSAMVKDLTMRGYDLAETLKSPTVWDRVKTIAKEKGLDLSFEVVKQLTDLVIKQILGG